MAAGEQLAHYGASGGTEEERPRGWGSSPCSALLLSQAQGEGRAHRRLCTSHMLPHLNGGLGSGETGCPCARAQGCREAGAGVLLPVCLSHQGSSSGGVRASAWPALPLKKEPYGAGWAGGRGQGLCSSPNSGLHPWSCPASSSSRSGPRVGSGQ